jgi:hypothetical protein
VASWGANRLNVFGLETANQIYHKFWDGFSWGPSSGWESLGGAFNTAPAVVSWGPNRLDVFGLGVEGRLYHKAWNDSNWEPSLTDGDFSAANSSAGFDICVTQSISSSIPFLGHCTYIKSEA